uniref:Uncharacterized protein n=1 Tax=Romanomermis culicivorax TaxID=13658 RepID=A0A915IA26_ROMCU
MCLAGLSSAVGTNTFIQRGWISLAGRTYVNLSLIYVDRSPSSLHQHSESSNNTYGQKTAINRHMLPNWAGMEKNGSQKDDEKVQIQKPSKVFATFPCGYLETSNGLVIVPIESEAYL